MRALDIQGAVKQRGNVQSEKKIQIPKILLQGELKGKEKNKGNNNKGLMLAVEGRRNTSKSG